jgi:hypothetical protein
MRMQCSKKCCRFWGWSFLPNTISKESLVEQGDHLLLQYLKGKDLGKAYYKIYFATQYLKGKFVSLTRTYRSIGDPKNRIVRYENPRVGQTCQIECRQAMPDRVPTSSDASKRLHACGVKTSVGGGCGFSFIARRGCRKQLKEPI